MKKILFAMLLIVSHLAYSADGSSGCGPGWYVLKDNSLLSSALRTTTHGILLPSVTIGMTPGTSGCTKHNIVLHEKKAIHFVTQNFYDLQLDIAKGDGAFITAFTDILACNQEELKKSLQKNYTTIFGNEAQDPSNVLIETYKVILRDQHLAATCLGPIS